MNRRIEYCSAAAGAVLLLSGYAKALDAAAFGATLARYGSDVLYWTAPVVVLTELFLGYSLLLGLRLRRTGAAATLFLAAVTGVYVYGLVFREVADCGCFGAESVFNGPPVVTFVRNALLAGLTFAVWCGGDDRPRIPSAAGGLLLVGMCAGAFMSGHTLRAGSQTGPWLHVEQVSDAVADTPLADMVGCSADSTCLVFAFSYTCPHCLNSIENLKRYEPEGGGVDRVVGLALENAEAERRFRSVFQPEFRVRNIPARELFRLTRAFPTAYYIRRDTVRAILTGGLPAALVFGRIFAADEHDKVPCDATHMEY